MASIPVGTAMVHRPDGSVVSVSDRVLLDDVLPGFAPALADVFD